MRLDHDGEEEQQELTTIAATLMCRGNAQASDGRALGYSYDEHRGINQSIAAFVGARCHAVSVILSEPYYPCSLLTFHALPRSTECSVEG